MRQGKPGRAAFAGKAIKSVIAAVVLSATGIALLSFVLYRAGLDAYAAPLLSDRYPATLVILSVILAPLLYRIFGR